MFKKFRDTLSEAFGDLSNEAKKFVNKKMLDAYMAGAAKMAIADGTVSQAEKDKFHTFIQNHSALSVFNRRDVLASFNEFINAYELDKDMGEAKALDAISKVKGKENEAKMVVRMVISIAKSDDDFDQAERNAALQIIQELGLNAEEFLG